MSFGLSSGGGQVRYALIVDDQATAKLNTFKTSLTQLGTGTSQLAGKMAIMNNSFSAGVTPIKNTGNALNQLSTTQKTLGSQLAGLGSAFKNNALAIGAAASSVLGLYQNYANLSSAQNAANKSATAASAAANKVEDMTRKLAATVKKYGANSKEAADVQKDLAIAQERSTNKAESAKIAQDNLNQTMADFGINILPNVLLAGGSIVSIFDGIGKSSGGLKGVISGLGGIFGKLIGSLTGVATGAPAAGAGMKLFAGGMDTAAISAKGLALALGPIAALIAGAVIGNAIKQTNPELTKFSDSIDKSAVAAANATGPLGNLFKSYREFMINTFPQFASEAEKASVATENLGKSAGTATAPVEKFSSGIKIFAGSLNEVAKSAPTVSKLWNQQASGMLLGGKAANDYSNILIDLNKQIFENTTLIGAQSVALANIPKTLNASFSGTAGAIAKVGGTATIAGDDIKKALDKAAASAAALQKATQDAASGFSDFAKAAQDILGKGFDKLNLKKSFDRVQKEADTFQANFIKSMDKGGFEGAKAFALKFAATPQKFIKPKDVIAFDSLIKWINANAGLPAEVFAKQLAIRWAQLAPETQTAFGKMMAGLPDEATTIGTDTGTAMGTATVAAFRKATDKKLFPQKGTMLGPLVGDKGGFPKTPITTPTISTPTAPTVQKTIIIADNSQAIKAVDVVAKRIASLSGIKAIISLVNQAAIKAVDVVAKRIDSLTGIKPQISLQNNKAIKVTDVVAKRIDSLEKIKPQISLQNNKAIKAVDVVAKRINGLEKIKPQINLNNNSALKSVDAVAKRINSLENINPHINVTVGLSGPGVKFLATGMHGTVNKPTLFMAGEAGPERIDVSPVGGSGKEMTYDKQVDVKPVGRVQRAQTAGPAGPTVIENHIHIMNEDIIRKIKIQSGQNRYAQG